MYIDMYTNICIHHVSPLYAAPLRPTAVNPAEVPSFQSVTDARVPQNGPGNHHHDSNPLYPTHAGHPAHLPPHAGHPAPPQPHAGHPEHAGPPAPPQPRGGREEAARRGSLLAAGHTI